LLQVGSWRLRVDGSRLWDRLLLAFLHKRRVTLCAPDAEADAYLSIVHAPQAAQPAPIAHQGHNWSLQREGADHRLLFDPTVSRAMHRYLTAMDEALRRLILDHGLLLLHAAAFQIDHRVTILAGEAGSGKSTIAVHAALSGGRLLSDDRVLLKSQGGLWISGCDGSAKLCDDAAQALFPKPIAGRRALRRGIPKTEFVTSGQVNALPYTDVRADRLVFLTLGSRLVLRPCPRAEALLRLVEATREELALATREQRKASLGWLGALVESVDCYDLERPAGLESLDHTFQLLRSAR
jgi:hypothetical protein